MDKVVVKILNKSGNTVPEYATIGSAGFDVRAHLDAAIQLKPFERVLVPTGIFLEIPLGYEGQVRPRSGLAIKQGLTVLNTPGTIDSDYRGEVKIILINLSNEPQTIHTSDRIAQVVISRACQADSEVVQRLEDSKRGTGGFGHTGLS